MSRVAAAVQQYASRAVNAGELTCTPPWRVKNYEIVFPGRAPDPALREEANTLLMQRLLKAGEDTNHYGVAFKCIHWGAGAIFAFVCWWADENELHHHVFIRDDSASLFKDATSSGLIACDLRLIAFERDAWVTHVLNDSKMDVSSYLGAQLSGMI